MASRELPDRQIERQADDHGRWKDFGGVSAVPSRRVQGEEDPFFVETPCGDFHGDPQELVG